MGAPEIPGAAADVLEWFGQWPTFHDGEVKSITLDWSGASRVEIYAFERTSEVDLDGYFVRAKHAVVTFFLEGFPLDQRGISNTRIDYFSEQRRHQEDTRRL